MKENVKSLLKFVGGNLYTYSNYLSQNRIELGYDYIPNKCHDSAIISEIH